MDIDDITIEALIDSNTELSSLPQIYHMVAAALDDEGTTHTQIGAIIHNDPALSAKILKTVNSAFYGFPRQISSISQAVSILGRQPVRHLLTTTVVTGMLSRLSASDFYLPEFWCHSMLTGLIARNCYAQLTDTGEAEALFVCGLLHDIGSLFIAHQTAQLVKFYVGQEAEVSARLITFEKSEVGATLIQHWGLPPMLVNCVRYHLSPQHTDLFPVEVWTTAISNCLAHLPPSTSADELAAALAHLENWQHCGLSIEQLLNARVAAEDQLQELTESLGLTFK